MNRNLSNCENSPKKVFWGFNGIRTRGLCVSAAVLSQLSYEDPYTGGWQILFQFIYYSINGQPPVYGSFVFRHPLVAPLWGYWGRPCMYKNSYWNRPRKEAWVPAEDGGCAVRFSSKGSRAMFRQSLVHEI